MSEQNFRGFKSPGAQRTFILVGCGVAILFLALQLLMPLWLGEFAWSPSGNGPGVRLEYLRPGTAAQWRGELWYIAGEVNSILGTPDNEANSHLVRIAAGGPQTVCTIAPGAAWLLPAGDSLWIFAGDGISKYDGKDFQRISAEQVSASATQPFLLGGLPAVAEEEAGEWSAFALEGGRWVRKPAVLGAGLKDPGVAPEQMKTLIIGGKAYVVCLWNGSVYGREAGAAASVGDFPAGWDLVCPAEGAWAAAAIGGRPAVFAVKPRKDDLCGEIAGFSLSTAGWKPVFSRVAGIAPHSLDAAPDAEGPGYRLVYQAVAWSVNIIHAEDGKILEARRYGELVPADTGKALRMLLPPAVSVALLIALVAVFSRLMSVYRAELYAPAGLAVLPPGVRLASVGRRAAALLIDFLILAGPLLAEMVAMFLILPGIEDRTDSRRVMILTSLIVAAAIWAVVGFLLFCYGLGRWGRTPGKWALGIRVLGMDLRPCGFARALLRSLLLFLDAFLLNFTIGVLLIAFTVNWQRFGDLAARTIVIREPAKAIHGGPVTASNAGN